MFCSLYYRPFCIRSYLVRYATQLSRDGSKNEEINDCAGRLSSGVSYRALQRAEMERGRRTVLIKTRGSASRCIDFCTQFGDVQNIYQHDPDDGGSLLVEYRSIQAVQKLLSTTKYFDHQESIPIKSRYIHFQDYSSKTSMIRHRKLKLIKPRSLELDITENSSLSAQMSRVHRQFMLSDGDRLVRYFIASTIEELLQQVLPQAEIQLFGSSASGLGRYSSDLDLVLNINGSRNADKEQRRTALHYLTRKNVEEREKNRSVLQLTSQLLRTAYYPTSHVWDILNARVPILKFKHFVMKLDCDLSIDSNASGPVMSELLYTLCRVDKRFPVLVDTIRRWAAVHKVTLDGPGPWLSNFMLTILITHYLQQVETPVLPPLDQLLSSTGHEQSGYKSHLSVSDDNFNKFKQNSIANTTCQGDLLKGFFQYYSRFDFGQHGISILTGTLLLRPKVTTNSTQDKPRGQIHCSIENDPGEGDAETGSTAEDNDDDDFVPAKCPVILENPLDPSHNCSQNVAAPYLEEFQVQCVAGAQCIERGGDLIQLLSHSTGQIQVRQMFSDVSHDSATDDASTDKHLLKHR